MHDTLEALEQRGIVTREELSAFLFSQNNSHVH